MLNSKVDKYPNGKRKIQIYGRHLPLTVVIKSSKHKPKLLDFCFYFVTIENPRYNTEEH